MHSIPSCILAANPFLCPSKRSPSMDLTSRSLRGCVRALARCPPPPSRRRDTRCWSLTRPASRGAPCPPLLHARPLAILGQGREACGRLSIRIVRVCVCVCVRVCACVRASACVRMGTGEEGAAPRRAVKEERGGRICPARACNQFLFLQAVLYAQAARLQALGVGSGTATDAEQSCGKS